MTLGDVLRAIEAGKSFRCEERPPRHSEVGVVKVSAVTWGTFDENEAKTCTDPSRIEPRFLIRSGDLLFSRANTIDLVGNAVIVGPIASRLMLSDKILRLRVQSIQPRWLLYGLRTPWGRNEIQRLATGNQESMRNIGRDRIRQIRMPLAPRAEQDRIVAEIEKQLTRVDAGVEGLKRLQVHLRRYRASVLKAACEGRLVPTEAKMARKEGRDYEPADKLLACILRDRRATWKANQLAKMKAAGKTPRDDGWKSKYVEPQAAMSDLLPSLPDGWAWISLDVVLADIEAGRSFRCAERPPTDDEVGVIKVSAVTWGRFDPAESKTCTVGERIDKTLLVREGDFLFSRANTIELVGACVIAGHVSSQLMLSDKILRFHLVKVDPRWILVALRSTHGRSEIERLATGNQESMRNIGQDRIRKIRIPLPPLAEQRRIIGEVEDRLSVADMTEAVLEASLARAGRLRQSVLKLAFEGRLVAQDPADEPAIILLKRIRFQGTARDKAHDLVAGPSRRAAW